LRPRSNVRKGREAEWQELPVCGWSAVGCQTEEADIRSGKSVYDRFCAGADDAAPTWSIRCRASSNAYRCPPVFPKLLKRNDDSNIKSLDRRMVRTIRPTIDA